MENTVQQTQKNQAERVTAWSVFSELVKLRLTTMVLITTLVGFYAGLNAESGGLAQNLAKLGLTLLGTGLLAAGAAILNQYLERDHDARMERTARRPLPSGAIGAEAALLLGGACSVVGLLALAAWVNLLVAVLGAVTLVTYLFIYTPLKRKSEWNTIVGAIPGALPPLMGWAAARGELDPLGWMLFGILFFWQMPHFMAKRGRGRGSDRPAGGQSHPLFVHGQPVAVHNATGRDGLRFRRGAAGRAFFVGRNTVFAAVDPAKRTGSVLCLHHLPAAAAGIDGGGQAEKLTHRQVAIDSGAVEPIGSAAFGSRHARIKNDFFRFNQR